LSFQEVTWHGLIFLAFQETFILWLAP